MDIIRYYNGAQALMTLLLVALVTVADFTLIFVMPSVTWQQAVFYTGLTALLWWLMRRPLRVLLRWMVRNPAR